MKHSLRFTTLLTALAVASFAIADNVRYLGRDQNWFNARNWSTGHVPGRGDDVTIGKGHVVIDPALGTPTVVIRDLTIDCDATLETLPGTRFGSRNELVFGSLIHRGTDATLDLGGIGIYAGNGNATDPGFSINPTPKTKRIIVLQSSFSVGLGGTTAASAGNVGRGYYANLSSEDMLIAGSLDVQFKYGFVPHDGDRFVILKADRILGRFRNLPEGAMVKQIGSIGIYIHYTAREHILLARQVGVPV